MKNYIFSHKICAVDMIKRKESFKNFQKNSRLQPIHPCFKDKIIILSLKNIFCLHQMEVQLITSLSQ